MSSLIEASICFSLSPTTWRSKSALILAELSRSKTRPIRIVSSKKASPAGGHLGDDVLDPGQVEGELAAHVLGVELELAVDGLNGLDIGGEDREALVRGREVALGEVLGDPEGAEELEPDPALLVERLEDVALQLAEPAGLPQTLLLRRVAVADGLGLLGEQGGDGKDVRPEAEQALDVLGYEVDDLVGVLGGPNHVDLVDDDGDLLAPLPDVAHELALDSVKGRSAEVMKRTRSARGRTLGERLVLADDGVGAGGVDEGDLVEELGGEGRSMMPSGRTRSVWVSPKRRRL
jgi:hypothetical protein